MAALYRVTHRCKRTGVSYQNEVVADSPADAIAQREIDLDIDEGDSAWEVDVDPVEDPDGRRARRWVEHFGAKTI